MMSLFFRLSKHTKGNKMYSESSYAQDSLILHEINDNYFGCSDFMMSIEDENTDIYIIQCG